MENDKSMLYIVAIVGIVAVAALVLMVMNRPSGVYAASSTQGVVSDASGGAFKTASCWSNCMTTAMNGGFYGQGQDTWGSRCNSGCDTDFYNSGGIWLRPGYRGGISFGPD